MPQIFWDSAHFRTRLKVVDRKTRFNVFCYDDDMTAWYKIFIHFSLYFENQPKDIQLVFE